MYRYRRFSPRREALGKLLGTGPQTFYARFKHYKFPIRETLGVKGFWALLTMVTDEDLTLLTDHLWAMLPPSSRYCSWALEPRTVLRLRASVGEYDTRRYDPVLIRSIGLTDYCFEAIFDYEPLKHFPVITPRFEREAALFFDKLIKKPELTRRWSNSPSITGLPLSLLELPSLKPDKLLRNVRV
jgi:hypothetical protein